MARSASRTVVIQEGIAIYPRNAASPERFDIGPVVQILDGVVQTSGVSVSVLPMGGVSGASGGTIAYENGIVVYTPTQAETNYTSVVFVAYKTGCIPASKTVVFSASATAGYAGTDQSKITNPTATVALTNTSINDTATVGGEAMRGTDGANTVAPLDATQTEAAAAAAIAAVNLDHVAGTATGIPALPAGTWLDTIRSDGTTAYDRTTDSLQAQRDAALTAAGAFAAVLTTQLTESYAVDGVAPTLAQAIFLIQQSLHEFAISGTTRTVKKLDGTTTAATFTLDSATAPTSTTRAT